MKYREQPLRGFLQNRFYDTLTLKKCFKIPYLWTSWFFREELVDLQLYYSRTLSQEVFKHMCFQYFKESKYYYGRTSANQYVKQKWQV